MPEDVDYDFAGTGAGRAGGSIPSYPWGQWLQIGVTRRYQQGVDFDSAPKSFAVALRRAAWRMGMKAEIYRGHDHIIARPSWRTDAGWLAAVKAAQTIGQ